MEKEKTDLRCIGEGLLILDKYDQQYGDIEYEESKARLIVYVSNIEQQIAPADKSALVRLGWKWLQERGLWAYGVSSIV